MLAIVTLFIFMLCLVRFAAWLVERHQLAGLATMTPLVAGLAALAAGWPR